MLLSVFWETKYWPFCEADLRESTRVGYESAYRVHVEPTYGAVDMGRITIESIDRWLAGFAQAGAARKSWSVLRAVLRRAVRWGVLDTDVTRRQVDMPPLRRYEPALLTIAQQRDQLRGFYGHALEPWLLCASCCGLRTEEGYGLEWADIDLRSGVVHVARGLQWVSGHMVMVEPKTELSRRTLPLPRVAVRRLRDIRDHGRLIGDLTPSQASRAYAAHCRRNNLPYVPVRNLRHSWATNALAAGADISVVSRMLGHSDIKTTARYYLRPDLTALRDAQRLFEKRLIA